GVGAGGKLVVDHGVDDDDAQLGGVEGDELFGEVAAVEEHGVAGFGADDGRLVHDAAGDQRVFMLGLLADEGQAGHVDVEAALGQETAGGGDFDGGGGGKPAAGGEGIGDEDVDAGEGNAGHFELGRDAPAVVGPGWVSALDFF